MPADYYGFEHVRLTIGHGDNVGGHYVHWLRDHGIDPDKVCGPENALERSSVWEQVYKPQVPAELYSSTFVAEECERFISANAERSDPFFLMASFPDPHHPFTPPGKYWDMYRDRDLQIPSTFDADHVNPPKHVRLMLDSQGVGGEEYTPWAPNQQQLRDALAAQYGMISLLDDSVARILKALTLAGVGDQTLILFTSDHGDMFGDHGLMLKHALHYQACTRVPFFMTGPGISTGVFNGLASTLDIAPTVLDAAGLAPLPGSTGRTLLSDNVMERSSALIEEDEIFDIPGLSGPFRIRTIVTSEARLTLYSNGTGELYNLLEDPNELVNIFGAQHALGLQSDLTEILASEMMNADDASRFPAYSG